MKKRLYVVLPDVPSARRTGDDLMHAGIDERHLHFLGARGTPLSGLHEAGVFQKSDVAHALALGAYFGALVGLGLGLHLWLAPPIAGLEFGALVLAPCTLGGALFGAWASSLVGVSAPNWKLRGFDAEFAAGHVLLMVDVPAAREAEIHALIARTHPEARERPPGETLPVLP